MGRDEHGRVAEVLGRAFFDDPFFAWMLPDPRGRTPWTRYILRTMIEEDAHHGESFVWERDGELGGALVTAPPARPLSLFSHALAYARAGLMPLPRWRVVVGGMNAQSAMDRARPKEPHWYVHVLGVDPAAQKSGGGRALLEPVLAKCDARRLPAHLETAKPANLDYYRRFGFEVTGELAMVKGAPPMWTMLRPAR